VKFRSVSDRQVLAVARRFLPASTEWIRRSGKSGVLSRGMAVTERIVLSLIFGASPVVCAGQEPAKGPPQTQPQLVIGPVSTSPALVEGGKLVQLLQSLVGQNVKVAFARLGSPQGAPEVDADVVYNWHSVKDYAWCDVRLFADPATGTVKRFAVREQRAGCQLFAEQLPKL